MEGVVVRVSVGAGPAVALVEDELEGVTVTARPDHLPLVVSRKRSIQRHVKSSKNVPVVRRRRFHVPLVHKTINVSIILYPVYAKNRNKYHGLHMHQEDRCCV